MEFYNNSKRSEKKSNTKCSMSRIFGPVGIELAFWYWKNEIYLPASKHASQITSKLNSWPWRLSDNRVLRYYFTNTLVLKGFFYTSQISIYLFHLTNNSMLTFYPFPPDFNSLRLVIVLYFFKKYLIYVY